MQLIFVFADVQKFKTLFLSSEQFKLYVKIYNTIISSVSMPKTIFYLYISIILDAVYSL